MPAWMTASVLWRLRQRANGDGVERFSVVPNDADAHVLRVFRNRLSMAVRTASCEMARIALGKSARAVFHPEQPQPRKNTPAASAKCP
jgi:hypothetical protein